MIKNKTKLQQAILEICHGYTIAEVIHAFEIIKLDLILDADNNLDLQPKGKGH